MELNLISGLMKMKSIAQSDFKTCDIYCLLQFIVNTLNVGIF